MYRRMYSEDSFYTLGTYGRLAVIGVSLGMFAVLLALGYVLAKARKGVVRIAIGMFLFWIFVWLSPQVYYTLYQFLFEGLPRQWVVGSPPHGGRAGASDNLFRSSDPIRAWARCFVLGAYAAQLASALEGTNGTRP